MVRFDFCTALEAFGLAAAATDALLTAVESALIERVAGMTLSRKVRQWMIAFMSHGERLSQPLGFDRERTPYGICFRVRSDALL